MLTYDIPGAGRLAFGHLVLDFNGTIASDGVLISGVSERLETLSEKLRIHVITADTNGSVHRECEHLPLQVQVIGNMDQAGEKARFIRGLGEDGIVAIGNGVNDRLMFETADLAIAVLGREGCSSEALMHGDIVVRDILDGLDLLLHPNRLIATLRR
ncbi:HAD family hydrolase [Ferviditalea candida]|uniref:Haloacid dehalogenase n=1 Tax=Ferviditalea candida TaxID=3108399 RepID=A0ABU5ZLD2_9BACL|nr:haloacid dehalogenase [Paenibacillaceae bacterium T2]